MRTESSYGSEVTRRARRVVADIFAALAHRAENAMLIGGAVPGLIEDLSLRNAPGHAGTTDVDILLDPKGFSIQEYEMLAERLLERGYRYRQDRDGNELKFSFEVDVDGHSVAVDFPRPANARPIGIPGADPGWTSRSRSLLCARTSLVFGRSDA